MSLINTRIKPFKATAFHRGSSWTSRTSRSSASGRSSCSTRRTSPSSARPSSRTSRTSTASSRSWASRSTGVSTDTHFAHKAWHDTSAAIEKVNYPLVGDPTATLSRNFGVLIEEEGLALRGSFLVNPDGVIKVYEVHDLGIGRSAAEMLRKVKAAQYVATHPGEVCPAKWDEGAKTLKPSLDLVGKI